MKTKEVNLSQLVNDLDDLRQRMAKIISDKDWTTLHDTVQILRNLIRLENQ